MSATLPSAEPRSSFESDNGDTLTVGHGEARLRRVDCDAGWATECLVPDD
jgi:hypothetical protein